ncbi:MAG: putative hydrolases or acyltransferases (alpha/beta hydrolase superfamily) [Marinobacter excellens HL-55]|uniref:Putative hydrolases or acyltransferases (Alpha/beta hydrolase superfamily) n=1 Tax=Marinobacter excellens HL-55 TaxID=1305731 RepID=A0A0P7ZA64_9GAMM|nr:MAG: putative hydrolases or acyltransferases (alpha/beta hydrolase superfamily) [Marinobacter excellens HL-55]
MMSVLSAGKIQQHISAIASGFLGDWLEARGNGLAVPMRMFIDGQPLDVANPTVDAPGSTLCLSIHGLMELDSVWDFPGQAHEHYGTRLAEAAGDTTALKLRFNSGRPIYRNGQDLADLLEQLVMHWPVPVKRLILLGHSMGGLLIRSACHCGATRQHGWISVQLDCVYIGAPHDGSWLAIGAHKVADRLNQVPRDYLKVMGEVIDLRSEGIRNLSRGEVFEPGQDEQPLLPQARHYVISGLLARKAEHPVNALFGDALVHESSARGEHRPGWVLNGIANFPGVDHLRLAHHPLVCGQLQEWLV